MTLSELRLALRVRLDDKVSPYLWSDASLNLYLNKAVDEACLRARLLTQRLSYPVAAGVSIVELDEKAFHLDRVSWAGYGALIHTGVDSLDTLEKNWEDAKNDWPTHYITDSEEHPAYSRKLRLHPIPQLAGTLRITAISIPEPMVTDSDVPAIEDTYHFDLLDWAAYLAYLVNDVDSQNLDRARFFEASFTQRFGPKPENRRIEVTRKGYPRRVIGRYF